MLKKIIIELSMFSKSLDVKVVHKRALPFRAGVFQTGI